MSDVCLHTRAPNEAAAWACECPTASRTYLLILFLISLNTIQSIYRTTYTRKKDDDTYVRPRSVLSGCMGMCTSLSFTDLSSYYLVNQPYYWTIHIPYYIYT